MVSVFVGVFCFLSRTTALVTFFVSGAFTSTGGVTASCSGAAAGSSACGSGVALTSSATGSGAAGCASTTLTYFFGASFLITGAATTAL